MIAPAPPVARPAFDALPIPRNRSLNALLVGLALLAFGMCAPARAKAPPSDDYLAGYVTSILEQKLGWARDSFRVEVRGAIATVVLAERDQARIDAAQKALAEVEGLQAAEVTAEGPRPAQSLQAKLKSERIHFPVGDPFKPLLADPKQPQFFFSFLRMKAPNTRANVAAVGYGENFGLVKWLGERPGDGTQISLNAGLFAQFNLSTPSANLVNADYTVGLALSRRAGPWSGRLNVYHLSSHLGDEFILDDPAVERVNLSLIGAEALASYDWEHWRLYGGGGYLLHRNPEDIERGLARAGLEYHGSERLWRLGRPVAGLDVHSIEAQDWDTGISLKAGFEFGQPEPGRRSARLMAEAYKGFAPFGQFYKTEIQYYGMGFYLGF
jgi:hypothetical protein